jgi:DNA-binding transcriptional ArsR family regulator
MAGILHALADPLRLRILTAVTTTRRTEQQLLEVLGVEPAVLCVHLRALAGAGLVARHPGSPPFYELAGPSVAALLEALVSLAERGGAAG